MRIGIVSYFFHPDLNPRAFRAFELARQFGNTGHDVTVFVPDHGYDYHKSEQHREMNIITVQPGFYLNKSVRAVSHTAAAGGGAAVKKYAWIKRMKREVIRLFYPGGFNFEFAFTCSKRLKAEKNTFDMLISIGLPICSHLAVARAMRKRPGLSKCCIADYGDPYSFSTIIRPPYFHRWLEKRMLKKFQYILTPTDKAVNAFTYFKKPEFIKVIPQGFDFSEVILAEKSENRPGEPLRIIFAGNFYKGVREPGELLSYLSTVNLPFKLVLYIKTTDADNMALVNPYLDVFGDRLEVHPFLPRLDCIYEMSKADFLVNILNTEEAHSPSKMIDYCLSKTPVFSYVPGRFNSAEFDNFLRGDYKDDASGEIDISVFDIRNVAKQILMLNTRADQDAR